VATCPRCGQIFPDTFRWCPTDGTALHAESRPSSPGSRLLFDRYRLDRLLGEGGMAKVFLAIDEEDGSRWAAKILDRRWASDGDSVARFFREARTSERVTHPGIVRVVRCGTTPDGLPALVMELLEGEDLEAVMGRGEPLALPEAIRVALEASRTLEAAHAAGIVHRDIKPSNLFLCRTEDGSPPAVKLLDFGVARLQGDPRLTTVGQILGTPYYMSPEQARGQDDLDARSDLYSLGATLFHLVCGRPPFDAESPLAVMIQHLSDDPPPPRSLRADLPEPLDSLLRRLLAKLPAERLQDATAVAAELEKMAAGTAGSAAGRAAAGTVRVVPHAIEEVRLATVLVAEALGEQAPATLALLGEEIERHGGFMERLAGRRAVGLFGLRLSFGDEPVRAVRAGTTALLRAGPAALRCVVATCRVSVGEGATAGPAVVQAAGLIDRAGPGQAIIDESTWRRVLGVFRVKELRDRPAGAPRAFHVGENIERTGLRVVGADTGAVGRDDELEHLWDRLHRAFAGKVARAAIVSGEPGIGKSRLKSDLVLRLEADRDLDAWYVEGAGQPTDREQPFSALGDALRRRADIPGGCPPAKATERFADLVRQVGLGDPDPDVVELLGFAAQAAPLSRPSLVSLQDAPQRLRERTQAALVRLFSGMAARSPLLLCIEDAHHLDRASAETLALLLDACARLPLFLLVLGRSAAAERFADPLADVAPPPERIELHPLSRSETRTLTTALVGGDEPPQALVDGIFERSGGVPLFVEELLLALRQEGLLVRDPATRRWKLASDAAFQGLPEGIEGVLQARLDALRPDLKDAVLRASVFGPVFWDRGLEALGVRDVEPILSGLVGREVIVARTASAVPDCREYAFRSALLQEAAYRRLPEAGRTTLHAVAADWLVLHGAAGPGVLAHHLEASGRHEEAAEAHARSGDRARERYANDEALNRYDRAIAQLDRAGAQGSSAARTRIDALFGREQVLSRLGRPDEAIETLVAAGRVAARLGDRRVAARAAVRRGAVVRLRDARSAVEILDAALDVCRDAGDPEWECQALRQLAQAAAFSGDVGRGTEAAAAAVALARGLPETAHLLQSLTVQGTVESMRGDPQAALAPFQEALAIAGRLGNTEAEADVRLRCGFLLSELGNLEAAEWDLAAARHLAEQTGNRRVLAFVLHNLGWVLWKRERPGEAREAEREALALAEKAGLRQVVLATEIYLALIDLGTDRADAALDRLDRVDEAAAGAAMAEQQLHARFGRALALTALRRNREAAAAALEAVRLFDELGGTQQFAVEIHLAAAAALEADGRAADAASMRSTAAERLQERLAKIADPDARGRLALDVGRGLPPDVAAQLKRLWADPGPG
jgi:tetratricopeptide (TPR) repeat protein